MERLISEERLKLNFLQSLAIKILSSGCMPQHIAVIMDGNRRWAKERNLPVIEGHKQGVKALDFVLCWAEHFQIPEITFYTFSTDNLRRSKDEVTGLFNTLEELMESLVNKIDNLLTYGIRISVFGNLKLLPSHLLPNIAKVMLLTRDNKKRRINFASFYKSSDELQTAASLLRNAVENGQLQPSDVDQELLEKCLYTGSSIPPDFLIRTSGEQRFSDFMLWQTSNKLIYFTNTKWPDITFWNIFKALFYYQFYVGSISESKVEKTRRPEEQEILDAKLSRIRKFLSFREERMNHYLQSLVEKQS